MNPMINQTQLVVDVLSFHADFEVFSPNGTELDHYSHMEAR